MGYAYDSKLNRDLAKTAMSIYTKSQGIKSLNESTINEEVLRENINGLIMNYVSDVIVLAEQELGREMTSFEINEASNELLNRINSISDNDKAAFINELAEEAAAVSTGKGGGIDTGAAGGSGKGRPSGLGTVAAGGGNINPRDYTSIDDYINTIGDDFDGADRAQRRKDAAGGVYENSGTGTVGVRSGGNPRRRTGQAVREAVTSRGTFSTQGDTSPYQAQFDALFNSSEYQGADASAQGQMVANLVATIANKGDKHAGAGTAQRRRSVREAVTAKGTFANKSRPENRAGTPDPLDPSSYGPGGFYDSGSFETTVDAIYANLQSAGLSNSQIGQFAAQVQALHQ